MQEGDHCKSLLSAGSHSIYQKEEELDSTQKIHIRSYNLDNCDDTFNQLLSDNSNNNINAINNNNNRPELKRDDENNIGYTHKYDEGKILDLKDPKFRQRLWNSLKLYAPKGDILSIIACNAGVVAITDGINKVSITKANFFSATTHALKHINNLSKVQRGLVVMQWSSAVSGISFLIDLIICGYKWYYNMYSHKKCENTKLCKQEIKNKFIGTIGGAAVTSGLSMFLGTCVHLCTLYVADYSPKTVFV